MVLLYQPPPLQCYPGNNVTEARSRQPGIQPSERRAGGGERRARAGSQATTGFAPNPFCVGASELGPRSVRKGIARGSVGVAFGRVPKSPLRDRSSPSAFCPRRPPSSTAKEVIRFCPSHMNEGRGETAKVQAKGGGWKRVRGGFEEGGSNHERDDDDYRYNFTNRNGLSRNGTFVRQQRHRYTTITRGQLSLPPMKRGR